MHTYKITSNFAQGEEVCLVGDCTNGDFFGVVIGHQIEQNNTAVIVSFAGEIGAFFESQLESREDRKVALLVSGN